MQYIYYDQLYNCWCITSRENYEARIRNARTVVRCEGFTSAEQVQDYLVNHVHADKNNITIIKEEQQWENI